MRPFSHIRLSYGLLLALSAYGALCLLRAPCLFQSLFHVPCPGCGMRRALLAALRGDFLSAFQFHLMFWSLPLLGALIVFDGKPFQNRLANRLCLFGVLLGFVLNYIRQLAPLLFG